MGSLCSSVKDLGQTIKTMVTSLAAFFFLTILSRSDSCCNNQLVEGFGDLDGTYLLVEDRNERPEEVCFDGCVYKKTGGLAETMYCFKENIYQNGSAECQAVTLDPSLANGSLEDLANAAADLENNIAAKNLEIEALALEEEQASNLNSALDDVAALLASLLGGSGRQKRDVPQTCGELIAMLAELTAPMDHLSASEKVTKKLQLSMDIGASPISECDPADIASLQSQQADIENSIAETKEENKQRIEALAQQRQEAESEVLEMEATLRVITAEIKSVENERTPFPTTPPTTTMMQDLPDIGQDAFDSII